MEHRVIEVQQSQLGKVVRASIPGSRNGAWQGGTTEMAVLDKSTFDSLQPTNKHLHMLQKMEGLQHVIKAVSFLGSQIDLALSLALGYILNDN